MGSTSQLVDEVKAQTAENFIFPIITHWHMGTSEIEPVQKCSRSARRS